jgi:UDP-N-acetylglucosamine diphosphorylase / glucose-1-phosphate thymidylyltransferase / UDP-N-acetylgalactosamine diphosphorylase / glucosamine-1-phosphate N-acetyltransferase / galactosamine-1-phosphate N-acetyltransferase
VKAILLAAGQSKRFWPLPEKSLYPLAGKALIEHQVRRLKDGGCDDITIVAGPHNQEALRALFPDLLFVEQKDMTKGMQGAMLEALPSCGDEPVLIVSGNDVVETSAYAEVRKALAQDGIQGALLAKRVPRYFPGGYLSTDGNRVTGIVEKPGEGNEPSDLVNIVVHGHRSAAVLLQALRGSSSDRDDAYERALDALFQAHRYEAVRYEGLWQAVKYPWHLLTLMPIFLAELKRNIHPTASVHPTAVVEGNVTLDEGVKILPHACVMGPCYVGKGTIVGNNALVRQSSVGDHCVVGYNTEVKGSALSHHVWTHSTYVGDSVIGQNVSFGAGSVTGNLRLDEGEIASAVGEQKIGTGLSKFGTVIGDHVRVGIHTGLNPGIKVGSETFIGSGCLVTKDIPNGSFVVMKGGEISVRPNTTQTPKPSNRDAFKRQIEPR